MDIKRVGIYAIYHDEKFYIGSSIDLDRRLIQHKSDLKKNRHSNKKLQNYVNKYIPDLHFKVIKICLKEDVRYWEQYYIDKFNPYFNIRKTVEGPILVRHSEETKRKISKNNAKYWKGKKRHPDTIEKLKKYEGPKNSQYGKKRSQDFKDNVSKFHKNKKMSEESRLLMSKAKGGYLFNVIEMSTGKKVASYINRSKCAKDLGLCHSKVCACLRGDRNHHKGYIFKKV